jgi:cold shock CspA family protein
LHVRVAVLRGTVVAFSDAAGLGTIATPGGSEYLFHVVEIADGTRTIDIGQSVSFRPLPRFGRLQAAAVQKA